MLRAAEPRTPGAAHTRGLRAQEALGPRLLEAARAVAAATSPPSDAAARRAGPPVTALSLLGGPARSAHAAVRLKFGRARASLGWQPPGRPPVTSGPIRCSVLRLLEPRPAWTSARIPGAGGAGLQHGRFGSGECGPRGSWLVGRRRASGRRLVRCQRPKRTEL